MTTLSSHVISIRAATSDDSRALRRLAALDSAPVPAGPVLIAEVDGRAEAALAIEDRTVVADPFEPTAELVDLLRVHALHLAA